MHSKRLTTLVSLIPQCELLADVGCDHGYVGIEALRQGKAQRVAFADISAPSLNKARANCPKQFDSVVTFHCQDGLAGLNADCAIIAGMGGLEIVSILQRARHLPQKLVLQPMRNQSDVRVYLVEHNYEIVTDVKFRDDKFYDVIVAMQSQSPTPLTTLEMEFGKTNLAEPSTDFVEYLRLERNKLNTILAGTRDAEVTARRDMVDYVLYILRK